MDDESARRAKLRDQLEREAAAPAEPARVPGRTTLVEQLFSPPRPTTDVPGKSTLVAQHAGTGVPVADVDHAVSQARAALAGTGDRERAYETVVSALAGGSGALGHERASELMELCIELIRARKPQRPAEVANRGVMSASSQLPFYGEIQASFGHHDVSGSRAQVGGSASVAAGELGARAYAVGDRVGFAGARLAHGRT